jgi:hypothetical protein
MALVRMFEYYGMFIIVEQAVISDTRPSIPTGTWVTLRDGSPQS